jgi:hypothetical protein
LSGFFCAIHFNSKTKLVLQYKLAQDFKSCASLLIYDLQLIRI